MRALIFSLKTKQNKQKIKKQKQLNLGGKRMVERSPKILASEEKATTSLVDKQSVESIDWWFFFYSIGGKSTFSNYRHGVSHLVLQQQSKLSNSRVGDTYCAVQGSSTVPRCCPRLGSPTAGWDGGGMVECPDCWIANRGPRWSRLAIRLLGWQLWSVM